jgi:hypothetical protein
MEITISANKMKQLMETADDTIKTFVSTPEDREAMTDVQIMELMGARSIEVDLSEDDCNLLH